LRGANALVAVDLVIDDNWTGLSRHFSSDESCLADGLSRVCGPCA
jgi:hypothetical protein